MKQPKRSEIDPFPVEQGPNDRYFLEIFSGSGRMAKAVAKNVDGLIVVEIEFKVIYEPGWPEYFQDASVQDLDAMAKKKLGKKGGAKKKLPF